MDPSQVLNPLSHKENAHCLDFTTWKGQKDPRGAVNWVLELPHAIKHTNPPSSLVYSTVFLNPSPLLFTHMLQNIRNTAE